MSYIVSVPLVVAKQTDDSVAYLYQGAHVPETIPDVEVERLAAEGFIREVIEAEAEADDSTPDPYDGVSVVDLKALIKTRNEGRAEDAKISPSEPGNRPELVAALVADDARA